MPAAPRPATAAPAATTPHGELPSSSWPTEIGAAACVRSPSRVRRSPRVVDVVSDEPPAAASPAPRSSSPPDCLSPFLPDFDALGSFSPPFVAELPPTSVGAPLPAAGAGAAVGGDVGGGGGGGGGAQPATEQNELNGGGPFPKFHPSTAPSETDVPPAPVPAYEKPLAPAAARQYDQYVPLCSPRHCPGIGGLPTPLMLQTAVPTPP